MFNLQAALSIAWTKGNRSVSDIQSFVEEKLVARGINAEVYHTVKTNAAGHYMGMEFSLLIDGSIKKQPNCILPCERFFWDTDGVALNPSYMDAANLLERCLPHIPEELSKQADRILFNLNK